ncbi:MAG: diphosphomevalonate decarboxylase, partial [Myxococcota bacterium]|nr:diphosphomevalonate decarboxylase [Myxococcota bacterium]
ANIALVKYWGKRDQQLKLPAADSLSLALEPLHSTTELEWYEGPDTLWLDGREADGAALGNAKRLLDALRHRAGFALGARIVSHNAFPTAAGLASSSSAFAALAVAASAAAGLELGQDALSALARLGSGSACRSVSGGWSQWQAGERADGADSFARQLQGPEYWPLRVFIAVLDPATKAVSSSRGMAHCAATSPYYQAWIDSIPADLEAALQALQRLDFDGLGAVAERSCLRMHAANLAAQPALCYLQPASWLLIEQVQRWRSQGLGVFFTIDAGPNVKLFCQERDEAALRSALEGISAVQELISCSPAAAARVLEQS